jgi:uncharacterized protein YqgV (UPF0045/DUF77 family)
MDISVDISLYPLKDEFIPAVDDFIRHISDRPGVYVVRNDLATQLYGDYDKVMDLLKTEIRRSWETHGKGVFVIKFLMDDLRGLSDD